MFALFLRGIARILLLRIVRKIVPIALVLPLAGCFGFVGAELNNRGGFIDAKLDDRWLIADTNQMRVLRAYILIGSIARLAQTQHPSDRERLVGQVNIAVKVASDAYYCAYSQPGRCVYFDERMVEAEVAVLRLVVAVLTKQEDEDLFAALSKQWSETFPLLKAADSFSKLVDAFTSATELATSTGKLIKSILAAGQSIYISGRRLGGLYRDSIELHMITVLGTLDAICAIRADKYTKYNSDAYKYRGFTFATLSDGERWAIDNFWGKPQELPDTCGAFATGLALWQKGSGDLSEWKAFLTNDAAPFSRYVIPNENSFVQASDLIWRACENITADNDQLSDCIGRRKLKERDETEKECAVDFDRKPKEAAIAVKTISEEEKKKAKAAEATTPEKSVKAYSAWTDQCRLILFAKTVELRAKRKSRADTRLYWLSELTPSPSHPIQNRSPPPR